MNILKILSLRLPGLKFGQYLCMHVALRPPWLLQNWPSGHINLPTDDQVLVKASMIYGLVGCKRSLIMENAKKLLMNWPLWNEACAIQRQVVEFFHQETGAILKNACPLRPFESGLMKMERNLFSILFLACAHPFALPPAKKFFCVRVNQCLRALVTGCDNLLDDEYKEVIPFALGGFR